MATTSRSRARSGASLPLALRLFLVSGALILLSVAAALWVAAQQGARQAAAALDSALRAAETAREQVSSQRREAVQLMAQLLAADVDLVRYMDEALGGGTGIEALIGLGGSSIEDLLQERQQRLGFDLGIVLDPDGEVQARSDRRELFVESYADDPFFSWTISTAEPVSGYWRSGAQLYLAALLPLVQQQDLVGFLLVGLAVDDRMARGIARLSDAEVAYWLPAAEAPLRVASSMSEVLANAATRQLPDLSMLEPGDAPLRLDFGFADQRWAASLVPLPGPEGRALGVAVMMTSAEPIRAAYRAIQRRVLLSGVLVMLLAIAASYAVSRRILQPVTDLSQAAERAAEGDYGLQIEARGGPEIERLARAFDSLLSDLREQRDFQGYLSNLARLMPSGEREPHDEVGRTGTAEPLPVRVLEAAVLAVHWPTRSSMRAANDGDTQDFDALAARHAVAIGRIADHGGQRLGSGVAGLRAAFSGAGSIERALAAALEILLSEPDPDTHAPGMALGAGRIKIGSHRLPGGELELIGHGPALAGVEALLVDAGPGQLLLQSGLAAALQRKWPRVGLQPISGRCSGHVCQSLPLEPLRTLAGRVVAPRGAPLPASEATVINPATGPETGTATRLQPGQGFGARYRIISVLGEGGMGVVYKAKDLELGDLVALKTLRKLTAQDDSHIAQLKSELKLARRITHPNVLRTHDFGEIGGIPFISMEYVRGMTLRYLLRQSDKVPFSAALRIARQLVAGLDAAHQVGVLHRDIKPENLILDPAGNAKLMDFGIARPLLRGESPDNERGLFIGTLSYAAPEQLVGGPVDARTDIYAVGAVLFELFCGQLPFRGNTPADLYMAQTRGEPARPKECWPAIPDSLEELILACVDPDPARRLQSAAEVALGLGGLRG